MGNDNFELIDDNPFRHSGDIKKALQEVYDHYRSVANRNDYLKKELDRVKDEKYRDEELAKMKGEYEEMRDNYYRGFPISKEEREKINEWIGQQAKCSVGAIGGRFRYEFIPTSIGTIGTIVDCNTGESFTFQNI